MMRENVSVQLPFFLGEDKKREHKRQHTSARKVARHISEEATEVSCFSQNSLYFIKILNGKVRFLSDIFIFLKYIPLSGFFSASHTFSDSVDIVINIFLKRKSKIFN
jgi:hypothetical protein